MTITIELKSDWSSHHADYHNEKFESSDVLSSDVHIRPVKSKI